MNRRDILATLGTMSIGLAGCVDSGSDEGTPTATDPSAGTTTPTSSQQTATRSDSEADTQTDDPNTTDGPPCGGPAHEYLQAPDGFHIEPYADSEALGGGSFRPGPEPGPRLLATYRDTLYATIPSQGRVVAFHDEGESGESPEVVTVLEDLEKPHGIAFHDDRLYLALAGSVSRYEMDGVDTATAEEVLVDDIPRGRSHWTRSIAIHDSRLYLAAGNCQSGNCSEGDDDYLSAITALDLDGSNPATYATGLRNAVGIGWHDGTFFATENGVDGLGPDLPPDEINVVEEGNDYGFPDCYGDNVPASDDVADGDCEGRTTPAVKLQAHVAPLGFGFATTNAFPSEYRGDMYVALHGSWTREDPVGYKIIQVPYADGTLGTPRDFVTGWMPEGGSNKDARGRPVDVLVSNGAMYLTDDMSGTIYRLCYSG